MSQEGVLKFLSTACQSASLRTRYNTRNLAQLLFHAKNDGFEFTAEEMAEVVGKLEANVILNKDKEKFDGSSRLWRQMWGTCHLDYVVIHLFARHTADEIQNLFPGMK